MPSRRSSSNPDTPDTEPSRSNQVIDIDDAAIDETASGELDQDLVELSNPDGEPPSDDDRPKGAWRERDANRRANGPDDLKG